MGGPTALERELASKAFTGVRLRHGAVRSAAPTGREVLHAQPIAVLDRQDSLMACSLSLERASVLIIAVVWFHGRCWTERPTGSRN